MFERDDAPGDEESTASETAEVSADEAVDAEASESPQDDNVVELPEPEVAAADSLQGKYEEAAARLRTVSKAYTDLQAEMDAFRRRQQVLAEAKAERKAAQVVERFFEPVQNLKRAMGQEDLSVEDLRGGVEMVLKQFTDRMEELGLREIAGVGSPFNPNVHDALAQLPVTDAAQHGAIIEVYATGWMVGDKVIQPAQVVVGNYTEPAEA
ncbi:MAG: nucleotide exchange factor GrpE [Myxococcota bacterium]